MSINEYKFELPNNIERYLAVISKLYAQDGKKLLQEIVVNSQIRVYEKWSDDSWDGGAFGHAIYFYVPEAIFLKAVKQKDSLQKQIVQDINNTHNIQGEFIDEVFLEVERIEDRDWRKESGLLITGKRTVVPEIENRIWGDAGYRVFMSHKAEVKKEVIELKEKLNIFGISSSLLMRIFVPLKNGKMKLRALFLQWMRLSRL